MLDRDRGLRDGVGEHDGAAVRALRRLGDAQLAVIAQGGDVDVVEADPVVGPALQDYRRAGVTEGQAGKPRVHRPLDFLLRRLGEVADVFAADHQGTPHHSGLQEGVGHGDAGEHSGTRVADVEGQRVDQAALIA